MEELKPLELIVESDARQRHTLNTIDDLHEIASTAALGPAVPELVRNQFAIAQNAFVYSWFFQPFLPVAEMYSILAIELALNQRLKSLQPQLFNRKDPPALAALLQAAIKNRLLLDDGFAISMPDDEIVTIDPRNSQAPPAPPAPHDQRYCYELLHQIPRQRNELAHGEYVMYMVSARRSLTLAAALINQLYPAP